jgi:hypothetical protein
VNVNIPDKKLFINGFLQPLSKLNDSCVVTLDGEGFSSLVCTSDTSVILHSQYKVDTNIDVPIHLNISDIKKVIKAFECISTDSFTITIDKNNINYSGPEIRFKYHLLEDGIITAPKVNVSKIASLNFPIEFVIQYKSLIELLRGSTFASESNKLYLYSKEGKIFGDLTDRARQNVDSISIPLSEYKGEELTNLCLNFELIRIISSVRVKQLECKINQKLGVVLFQLLDGPVKTRYIASSLIK